MVVFKPLQNVYSDELDKHFGSNLNVNFVDFFGFVSIKLQATIFQHV